MMSTLIDGLHTLDIVRYGADGTYGPLLGPGNHQSSLNSPRLLLEAEALVDGSLCNCVSWTQFPSQF